MLAALAPTACATGSSLPWAMGSVALSGSTRMFIWSVSVGIKGYHGNAAAAGLNVDVRAAGCQSDVRRRNLLRPVHHHGG
jgi:hypothetical protein